MEWSHGHGGRRMVVGFAVVGEVCVVFCSNGREGMGLESERRNRRTIH